MKRILILTVCTVLCACSLSFADRTSARRKRAAIPVQPKTTAEEAPVQSKTPAAAVPSAASASASGPRYLAADFEKQDAKAGPSYGTWNKDPQDITHTCRMDIFKPGCDGKGSCVKLSYNVDSPDDYYNGFWLKFKNNGSVDLSKYSKMVFWVKGDPTGYTKKFKLEIKGDSQASSLYTGGYSTAWTKVEVPLSQFEKMTDWTKIKELVICFDQQVSRKKGAIYVDNIAFEK